MNTEQQLGLALGLSGLTEVSVATNGHSGAVALQATSRYEIQKPLTIAATLHPSGSEELRLEIHDPPLTVTVVGPVSVLNSWQAEEDPFQNEARTVEMMRAFKVNGHPSATKRANA